MKVAVIHDDLMRRGGAERVALSLIRSFPKADFYTLCYQPELTYEEFRSYKIHTTWFQKIAPSERSMKMFFYPMGIWAMKSLDLRGYDLVLISTTFCAKYIKLDPATILVTYCHTPFRLAWYPETYNALANNVFLKFLMYKIICPRLRVVDKKYALRTNYFIANSTVTVERIRQCYSKDIPITLISPPVDLSHYSIQVDKKPNDYYLVVSRFQPYKKIDLVIEVFNLLSDKKLIIVGTGVMEKSLKELANDNIEFKGVVDSQELAELYANCKALIFPQVEDFGITPLEANASGRPVIAFKAGGVLETMIPFQNKETPFSALFFEEQSTESLKKAIHTFETIEELIDENFIRKNAERFSEKAFISNVNQTVMQVYDNLK